MNYGAQPGQRITSTPNPVTGTIGSAPFNYTSYNPGTINSSGISAGAGSNQYQDLPPWMNTSGASMNYASWSPGGGSGSLPMSGIAGGTGGIFSTPQPYTQGSPTYSSNYGLGVPQQGSTSAGGSTQWTGAGGGPFVGATSPSYAVEQPAWPGVGSQLSNFVSGNIGRGVPAFNLPTALPFGGTTQPGQLNAMANPLLQNMMQYYQGGQSNMPGANTLSTIANQGISALPEWQSMVNAMGQNTAQNQAQLAEQFGAQGSLGGTSYGNAMSNYMQGVNAQQNALLGQLQQQNILQGQIPVAEQLMGGAQNFGQYAQGLNQQAIQNIYNEMIRTSPQYNPMLQQAYGLATTYDPIVQNPAKGGGILGGLAGAAPGILSTIASLAGLA